MQGFIEFLAIGRESIFHVETDRIDLRVELDFGPEFSKNPILECIV